MATDNPDFELGDEYTGPDVTDSGKVINTADGTYVEGGVRYVWTGEGDNFIPEGGWGDTPEQLAADELYAPGGELNPLDEDGNPLYRQVLRADGSVQPGGWSNNPDFYMAQERPADFDAVDSQNRRKWIVGEDSRENPTWTLNPDYNSETTPGPTPGTTPGTGTDAAATATAKKDAFAVVDDLVRSYGLDQSVADFIKGEMKIGQSRTAIAMKIRDLPAYNLRFPAMKARIDAGLPALTENEYMALETDYRSAMQAADLPANFSDSPDDFAALIEGDVSVAELQSRVALAEQALDTANQDTIAQLQNFYDLPKGSLTAYFLDPQRAKNVFEQNRRMEAAGLSAGAMRAVGPSQGLKRGTAERLQREGVAQSQLVQRLSARRGLAEATLGAEAVTADELALGEFGITPESVSRVRRETEQRASRFAGQAGTLMDRAGFTGLGEAN